MRQVFFSDLQLDVRKLYNGALSFQTTRSLRTLTPKLPEKINM